ncbi:MAG: ribonuclease P protein component [Ruminococcus sp.]|nr:ribonuclease P protein component [Ruminococcus sp.]
MLYTEILNDNKDFLTLYKRGRFTASKYTVIYVRSNGKPYNRLGITAGKKIGNAVCRNRAKRLIRLAYREAEINLPIGIDMVIVARRPVCEIKSQEYCAYMNKYAVPEIHRLADKFGGKKTQK